MTSEGSSRYRSLFVVGRGGMGRVEVALERGPLGFERVVALKRLLPEGAQDPRLKEMFLREARLAALLSHPNVVHAFAFGEAHGELFLAMEYVEGEPLSQVLAAARREGFELPSALVAHLLAEVCDGLHAAHELRDPAGQALHVVHRDVSPHNVMVSYEGHVKLLDFGVAKLASASQATRTGEVKGKMAYMSPEQALGEKLDRRSDLFSIGAVLFECLTGRRLWGDGTDVVVMRRLALEDPPRLEDHVAHAPPALASLYTRLVARPPGSRPADARQVAAELRAFAASASPVPDAASARDLMARLFAKEAAERRARLTEQLERAAPAQVDELRRSLEPGAIETSPTRTEPIVLGSGSLRRSRRWAIWVAFAAVAIAATAAAKALTPRREIAPAPAPAPASASASASAPAPAPASAPTPTPTPSIPSVLAPHPLSPKPHPPRAKPPDVDPSPF